MSEVFSWPQFFGPLADIWPTYAALVGGYLIGSIPFGYLLTRIAGLGDIRKLGSGNIGATNVLRTGNKPLAVLTLLLDGLKGAAAALIAAAISPDLALIAAGGAFLGHLFPVWLRFRGGKGVATYLGVALALAWPVGVGLILTWVVIAAIFRISSLSALVAAAAGPIYAYLLAGPALAVLLLLLTILVVLRHQPNICRLIHGQEPRIGQR